MFQNIVFLSILIILNGRPSSLLLQSACDGSKNIYSPEGNIGQVGKFPWLGILRCSLYSGQSVKIAVTGLILVKKNYCIANAIDIAKISKSKFKSNSKAMFIKTDGEPKFSKLKDYMLHPEFDYSTKYTVALVELADPATDEDPSVDLLNIRPICWPTINYNTNNQLYAIGYTDENMLLEKVFYKLQYIDNKVCDEFYQRVKGAGLSKPTHYLCAFAMNNTEKCVWDNGMALISNSSGHWTLIGLGLQGPGCAAPARFLDMLNYLPWVKSATSMAEISDYRRKSAFGEGFPRNDTAEAGPAIPNARHHTRSSCPLVPATIFRSSVHSKTRLP